MLDNLPSTELFAPRGAVAALKQEVAFAEVHDYAKMHDFSSDAPPELIARITEESDVVLTAIGDCGSRCSCRIRAAGAFKR